MCLLLDCPVGMPAGVLFVIGHAWLWVVEVEAEIWLPGGKQLEVGCWVEDVDWGQWKWGWIVGMGGS